MLVKPTTDPIANIKLVGVGGGGCNAVNTMISQYNIEGVEFIAVNTDAQVLKNSLAPVKLQIGQELTRGLGVGGDPELGAQAAEESIDELHEHLDGADMIFVTAGMGGGTGTGAAPVVSSISKKLNALTVAVVTKPFNFEGKRRADTAEKGIQELKDNVDTLIVVPNQRLLEIIEKDISFLEAMRKVDSVLAQGVNSISSLVTQSGFINVDFADVKSVMSDAGSALMGMGNASGENRAEQAAQQAINSPLLEMSVDGATGVLLNVIGGGDLSMREVDIAAQMISEVVDPSANIIFGATVDEELEDELKITVLATGFNESVQEQIQTVRRNPVIQNFANRNRQQEEQQSVENTVGKKPPVENVKPNIEKRELPKDIPDASDDDDLDVPAFLRRK